MPTIMYSLDNRFWPTPCRIHLISRPKLHGLPGRHYGVAVEFTDSPPVVYDLVRVEGFGVQSIDEFLQGHSYRIEQTLDDYLEVEAAWYRLQEGLADTNVHQYGVIDHNCEHVARYIVEGKRTSRQVLGTVAMGAVAVLAVVAVRK